MALVNPLRAAADGDPASDYLVLQTAFVPLDAGFTPIQQVELGDLLAASAKQGYVLRVAVIRSPADLGSVGALWRRPQAYANFLGVELSLTYKGELLVVMPDGYGTASPGTSRIPRGPALLPPADGGLARGTLAAVKQLLTKHHVSLRDIAAAEVPRAADNGGGPIPSLAFLLGLALVIGAWTVSLRIRPLYSD